MAYDRPYRLERYVMYGNQSFATVERFVIMKTGEGEICSGENFTEMRKLVDSANDLVAIESGDRGR